MTAARKRTVLISAIWATFFVFGFQLAGVGPLIAVFANRTGVSIETIGVLFTVQSLSSLIAATLIGSIIERFSIRAVILFGLVAVSIGLSGLLLSQSFPLLLLAGAIGGFGMAFMESGGQLLIVAMHDDKNARPLNSLHFLFSLGAVIGPFLAAYIGINMFVAAVGVLVLILPMLALTLPKDIRVGGNKEAVSSTKLYRSPVLWMFGLMILIYVGIELGIGNWTTEYLAGSTALDRDGAALVSSLYWLAFMFSRLIVTAFGSRLSFERQLGISACLAVAASLFYILTVGSTTGAIAATLLLGFSFGPIYPATFVILTRTFASSAGRAAGVISAAGSIGAMLIVPLQGVLLERTGGQIMSIYVAGLATAMLICFAFALRGAKAQRAAAAEQMAIAQ